MHISYSRDANSYILLNTSKLLEYLSSLKTDEIDQRILGYITEKKGNATKNNVVNHMNENGLLSRIPTLKKLKELESSGKITVQRGKNNRRGQAHFLVINNQSAYNRIYSWLIQIDEILNEIRAPMQDIQYYICGPAPDDPDFQYELNKQRSVYLENLRSTCLMPIERFLDFLFILSNRVIQSEKDSQLLNERIVDLYLKSMDVFLYTNTLDDMDSYLKNDISNLDSCLKDARINRYVRDGKISLDFGHNLRGKIEKFRKEIIEDFARI